MIETLLFFVLIFIAVHTQKSNYTNYVDYQKPFENPKLTCPENYGISFERIRQQPKTIQPFGYTKNEYIDKTRFIQTDQPLPTNPDFFI